MTEAMAIDVLNKHFIALLMYIHNIRLAGLQISTQSLNSGNSHFQVRLYPYTHNWNTTRQLVEGSGHLQKKSLAVSQGVTGPPRKDKTCEPTLKQEKGLTDKAKWREGHRRDQRKRSMAGHVVS